MYERRRPDKQRPSKHRPKPPADIQAILTVIGRRETKAPLDLTHTQLAWVNLRKANLHEARLGGADLHGATLGGADLGGRTCPKPSCAKPHWAGRTCARRTWTRRTWTRRTWTRRTDEADLRKAKNLTKEQIQAAKIGVKRSCRTISRLSLRLNDPLNSRGQVPERYSLPRKRYRCAANLQRRLN